MPWEIFKNFGITFDAQLQMHIEINKLAIVGNWIVKRLLRGRRFFFDTDIVLRSIFFSRGKLFVLRAWWFGVFC